MIRKIEYFNKRESAHIILYYQYYYKRVWKNRAPLQAIKLPRDLHQ
jgi:hypothetical protein